LLLEKQEELEADQFQELSGVKKAFSTAKPLVFLNACEVGRQEPALTGAGGFAEAFMALGASGVIAPLWSVKDSIAHEIAQKFYERVRNEPNTPFAQILADLRKQSYKAEGGEDTYAAYCFYGDPLARRAQ
jgi:CHAT domain-containing protein